MSTQRRGVPGLHGVLLLALLAPAAGPAAAAAQETAAGEEPVVSEQDREQSREFYRRGRRLLDRNRPEDALQEFSRAYALYPHWATSNSMGVCHDRLGRPSEALRLYEQALEEGGDGIPEDQRRQIEQRVSELRIQLGIREVTTGRIRITSQPPGAAASVDGLDVGVTPVEVDAGPGPHRVTASLEGYLEGAVDVDVTVGETSLVALALEAIPEAAPETGRLVCWSSPAGARVFVDGEEVGHTPVTLTATPAGERVVRIELDDGRVVEERVTVPPRGMVRVGAEFGGTVHQAWFWGTAGAALAFGVTAAATGGYGTSLAAEFDDPATTDARRSEIQPVGRSLMAATDVFASAAIASAAAAAVLYFFTDFGGEGGATVSVEQPPALLGLPEPLASGAVDLVR